MAIHTRMTTTATETMTTSGFSPAQDASSRVLLVDVSAGVLVRPGQMTPTLRSYTHYSCDTPLVDDRVAH